MIKKTTTLIFILVLVVGCSKKEDTRLICECLYEQTTKDTVAINLLSKKPEKTSCREKEPKSLVFNESKRKFVFENTYLGERTKLVFYEDKITNNHSANEYLFKFSFNRINLKFKQEFGIMNNFKYEEDGGFDIPTFDSNNIPEELINVPAIKPGSRIIT